MITFTDDALNQAFIFKKNQPETAKNLRVYIEGKGCDGFYYGVAFDSFQEEDHLVSLEHDGDILEVLIDKDSAQFLIGSTITWVDDERGKGFLVENPRHKKFRGKFYKKKSWKERLV